MFQKNLWGRRSPLSEAIDIILSFGGGVVYTDRLRLTVDPDVTTKEEILAPGRIISRIELSNTVLYTDQSIEGHDPNMDAFIWVPLNVQKEFDSVMNYPSVINQMEVLASSLDQYNLVERKSMLRKALLSLAKELE